MFVAVTGEEYGLLGADYLAANPTVPADKIVGLVNLDMPLLLYDFTDVVALSSLGVEGMTATIAAKADEGRLVVDVAKLKLPVGDHLVVLQGIVKFKHLRGDDAKAAAKELAFLVHSKPIVIRVKPIEKKA